MKEACAKLDLVKTKEAGVQGNQLRAFITNSWS
jgi:hypothetical protein